MNLKNIIITVFNLLVIISSAFTQINIKHIHTKTDSIELSEKELIQGLKSLDPIFRDQCAKTIRERIINSNYQIQTGNIFEHDYNYWLNKVNKIPTELLKEKFLKLFEIDKSSLEPNYANIKFYRLDHIFLAFVEFSKKKVKILRIDYQPEIFNIAPPINYNGIWKQYFVTGQISSKVQYMNGKKHGQTLIYSHEGKLAWENEYENGLCLIMKSYENGKISKVYTENLNSEIEENVSK